jgi:hypothetical protein
MDFISPSRGKLDLDAMFDDILDFASIGNKAHYKLIVGADSHTKNSETIFVVAVIIHHVGKGARYYYHKDVTRRISSLRQRIFYEASLSLETAAKLTKKLSENGASELNIEIHLDIGEEGKTKELIREVVGMVVGSGFNAKIKPDSSGASKVADKHTK